MDTPMPEPADVELVNVSKRFGNVVAVERITLTIPAGTYTCLLGPSGCGKTTTLRLLAGHERVTSGTIRIGPTQVTHLPPAQRGTATAATMSSAAESSPLSKDLSCLLPQADNTSLSPPLTWQSVMRCLAGFLSCQWRW